MKPKLKAPGTKRLKLEYDELLSTFAFKSNLRHYSLDLIADYLVGRRRLTPSNPR